MSTDSDRETVLIVDDMPDNLRVLSEILGETYSVRVAASGRRALDVAASPPKPDLILLDVIMPTMDGYECLRRLQEREETRDIPVIFITALDSSEDESLGLDLGAVDYIAKPVRPAIVHARVRTHLELKRARDEHLNRRIFLEQELNHFLDILAHHLQEPVRRQITFVQMLDRTLTRPLEPAAETAIDQIQAGANRFHRLLQDIRRYLGAKSHSVSDGVCSADEAFDAASDGLFDKALSRDAAIESAPLPRVRIDRDRLTDVFSVLLDNAIEHACSDSPARVRVESRRDGSKVVFSVTDNGPGIAPEFRERVFRPLERLHTDESRPGTGIGLALAKKIVEAAGGGIWIEDGETGGARVCFSLSEAEG